jgi:hypothetical protein
LVEEERALRLLAASYVFMGAMDDVPVTLT